jgi:YebC/PmpR family DNA-binding regulatory protein
MSGHNKWSKIKNKKGAADSKRSAIFARLAKAIVIAAREGGGDPTMNFKLRMAMDQAKSANMPSDNVDRAIKRGTGDGEGGQMEEGIFEAYGPGGIGIIVETLSDNKNRVVSEVQHTLKKSGATPAESGSVLFNFERKTVITIVAPVIEDQDSLELALIDAGADDIQIEDEGVTITGEVRSFQSLVEAVEANALKADEAGLQYVAMASVSVDEVTQTKIDKIVDALEELDDVQTVFTTVA